MKEARSICLRSFPYCATHHRLILRGLAHVTLRGNVQQNVYHKHIYTHSYKHIWGIIWAIIWGIICAVGGRRGSLALGRCQGAAAVVIEVIFPGSAKYHTHRRILFLDIGHN